MNDIDIAKRFIRKADSSRDRNIPFVLSFTEYKRLLNTRKCYYTGVELVFKEGDPNNFTLDRIDSSKGYMPGNVVACCLSINQKKKDLTLAEMKMMFNKLKRRF